MEMNQSQRAERIRSAVGAYVEDIAVPGYDPAAVRRRFTPATGPVPPLRWAVAAPVAAAALVVLALVLTSPAVIAQVQRMLRAFASIDGQPVAVAVHDVTFDQARKDLPFAVIAPAAIPAGLSESVTELLPSSSRLDSRLLLQFTSDNRPALTIIESREHAGTPQQIRLWLSQTASMPPGGAPARLPAAQSGQKAFVEFRHDNGQIMRQVRLEPIVWIVRGTRIELISPPGLFSNAQLAAIRRAMTR